MYDRQRYDSPPMYSPPYTHSPNGFPPPGSFMPPKSDFDPYPPPPGSYYLEEKPQYFYKWRSPPGIIKILEGLIIVLCIAIFACVASTLVWDMQYGYGMGMGVGMGAGMGMGMGMGGYGMGSYGVGGYGSGGYGMGYYNTYPTPYSAKTSMIAMAAINFIASLAVFVASFSKTSTTRSRKFYLVVLVISVILAFLQGIINIVYIVGVNPMAQSMRASYYDPMLMMCNSMYGSGVGGYPSVGGMYNQYLYHYCYVDAQEAVAMVCGFLVVISQCIIVYFAQKTRSKIWRYGKPNIYWEQPLTGAPGGHDVEDWVNNVEGGESIHDAPTLVMSEKPTSPLNAVKTPSPYPIKSDSCFSSEPYKDPDFTDTTTSRPSDEPSRGLSSSPSEEVGGTRRPSAWRGRRRRRNPELDDSQYETDYTTGGETCGELDEDQWHNMYPRITSDTQRQEYKREFDSDLKRYKRLCAEMDDINDQMNKLSRELDTLQEGSTKYQGVAEEFNRLKDVKRTPDYQTKKLECRELRHKLFHIKSMVKNYDKGHS